MQLTYFKTLFFLFLIITLFFALLPVSFHGSLFSNDKLDHLIAFFILSWLLKGAFASLTLAEYLMLLLSIGGIIEIAQYFNPPRSFSLMDLSADLVGIFLFFVLYHLYQKRRHFDLYL